jgi:futalosine hydrolase
MELAPIVDSLQPAPSAAPWVQTLTCDGRDVDVLATGVGMVATAAWTSRALASSRYDVALNVGVCGSFDRSIELASVVHVVEDRLAELGAEDDARFLTLNELGLSGDQLFVNPVPPASAALDLLRRVNAITVNTVHGNEQSIARIVERFAPQVESMEGAAFMCACLIHHIPFAQIRGVSNVVEKRNRGAWQLSEAIASAGRTALAVLHQI